MRLIRFRGDRSISRASGKLRYSLAYEVEPDEGYFADDVYVALEHREPMLGFHLADLFKPSKREVMTVLQGDGYPLSLAQSWRRHYRLPLEGDSFELSEQLSEQAHQDAQTRQAKGTGSSTRLFAGAVSAAIIISIVILGIQILLIAIPLGLERFRESGLAP